MSATTDVLVVGGGPAGASAAWWLARQGHEVMVVERRVPPRDKTCGDALTPRAFAHLVEMGLGDELAEMHPHRGVRVVGHGRTIELDWSSLHDTRAGRHLPDHGVVVPRRELDALVLGHAEQAGATVLCGREALAPIVERGFVRGALVQGPDGHQQEVRATYVVVADGANSRFGRALGTFRTREWPYATAIRSYWESPRHTEERLEAVLDVTDRDGQAIPGFGWVFPLGDGTVNVGVGLLSTYREFRGVNTSHLLDEVVGSLAGRWGIDPERPLAPPVSGRIPMGGSVGPKAGPTFLVIGDAAASVSPLSSDGLDGAYLTGRLAADALHTALADDDPGVLQRYPKMVEDAIGRHFAAGRGIARALGRPRVTRAVTASAMRSPRLMARLLRASSDLRRPAQPALHTTVDTSSSSRS